MIRGEGVDVVDYLAELIDHIDPLVVVRVEERHVQQRLRREDREAEGSGTLRVPFGRVDVVDRGGPGDALLEDQQRVYVIRLGRELVHLGQPVSLEQLHSQLTDSKLWGVEEFRGYVGRRRHEVFGSATCVRHRRRPAGARREPALWRCGRAHDVRIKRSCEPFPAKPRRFDLDQIRVHHVLVLVLVLADGLLLTQAAFQALDNRHICLYLSSQVRRGGTGAMLCRGIKRLRGVRRRDFFATL
jgi:hypothetical protein